MIWTRAAFAAIEEATDAHGHLLTVEPTRARWSVLKRTSEALTLDVLAQGQARTARQARRAAVKAAAKLARGRL